jgi:hypothetical protein
MPVTHKIVGVLVDGADAPPDLELPAIDDLYTDRDLARAEGIVVERAPGARLVVATDGPDLWRALWLRRGDSFGFVSLNEGWDEEMLMPDVEVDDPVAAEALPSLLRGSMGGARIDCVWPSFAALADGLRSLAAVISQPKVEAVVDAGGRRYLATVSKAKGFKLEPMSWSIEPKSLAPLAERLFKLDAPLPEFPFGAFQKVKRQPPSKDAALLKPDPARPFTSGTARMRITRIEVDLGGAVPAETVIAAVSAALADPANQGNPWTEVRETLYRRLARVIGDDKTIALFCDAICRESPAFDELFVKIAPTAALERIARNGLAALSPEVAARIQELLKRRRVRF